MSGSIKGPRAKIERAKKHIGELETAVSGLVFSQSTHPHVIVSEDDKAAGKKVYKAAKIPCVPDDVAAIAGDAIYNLRSALDLLMTQLVERAGNMPTNRHTPYFPVGETRKGFEARCNTKIERLIGKDALDCVRAAEAYRGGKGEAAWYLHHLDIEDKHRVSYALGFDLAALTLPYSPSDIFTPEGNAAFAAAMDDLFWKPNPSLSLLKEGDPLLAGPLEPENDPKFRFDVTFGEPQIVQAKPVLPTLTEYGQAVEALVDSFAPLF